MHRCDFCAWRTPIISPAYFDEFAHAQVFFVSECQAKGLEVAIALPKERPVNFEAESAQRYLLSPGDQFFVPPNNVYRLENHSTLKACKLFWAIIKVRTV